MIYKTFEMQTLRRTLPVYVERFSSASDLLATLESRKPRAQLQDDAFLHGAMPKQWKKEWYGFSDPADLKDKLISGTRDDKLTYDAKRFANEAKVQDKDKLCELNLNVYGGAVCVPAYLSDSPRNMWMMRRKRVPSRILHLAIDCAVCYANSADTFRKVGSAMVKTIARLEKAGYRVRITGVISVYDDMNKSICLMSIPLKRESEVMDFRRILYPLTDVSFFRGIGFDWLSCFSKFSGNNTHLGQETQCAFDGSEEDRCLQELYEKALGKDAEYLPLRDMTEMIRRGKTEEQVQRYIESRILNTDA